MYRLVTGPSYRARSSINSESDISGHARAVLTTFVVRGFFDARKSRGSTDNSLPTISFVSRYYHAYRFVVRRPFFRKPVRGQCTKITPYKIRRVEGDISTSF